MFRRLTTSLGLVLWLTALAWPHLALPAPPCERVFAAVRSRPVTGGQDTAIELELFMSERLLSFLTTENQRVSGLLRGLAPPPWLASEYSALATRLGHGSVENLPWDMLSLGQKQKLLRYVAEKRKAGASFFRHRLFDGLVVRPEVQIHLNKPATLFGASLAAGDHRVALGQLIQKIEFGGAKAAEAVSLLELHLRVGGGQSASGHEVPAGTVSRNASELLELIGLVAPHQHAHIVSPLPAERLKSGGELEAARMTDFVRRANLAVEMMAIVEHGTRIVEKDVGNAIAFDSFDAFRMHRTFDFFRDVGQEGTPKLGDSLKLGFVAVRGPDKYDGLAPLWGLEVRFIPKDVNREAMEHLLNALQASMNTGDFGLEPARFQSWWDARGKKNPSQEITENWYNREWKDLVRLAPPELKAEFGRDAYDWLRSKELQFMTEETKAVKMLVHNWSHDPLVDGTLASTVVAGQLKGLGRLKQGHTPTEVVRAFLLETKLYDTVLGTIGPR